MPPLSQDEEVQMSVAPFLPGLVHQLLEYRRFRDNLIFAQMLWVVQQIYHIGPL